MRGEYLKAEDATLETLELPPRARRIPLGFAREDGGTGTTSACAENTPAHGAAADNRRNYLRVRGEYNQLGAAQFLGLELPPRARRIPGAQPAHPRCPGTTSACAENTRLRVIHHLAPGNYLRVRGEYARGAWGEPIAQELPPRARRIPPAVTDDLPPAGTTSACAENTRSNAHNKPGTRNYLRVRGEYPKKFCELAPQAELPPRARRIPATA